MKSSNVQRRSVLLLLAGIVLVLLVCKSKPENEPKLADSKRLKFEARALAVFGDEKKVVLGF